MLKKTPPSDTQTIVVTYRQFAPNFSQANRLSSSSVHRTPDGIVALKGQANRPPHLIRQIKYRVRKIIKRIKFSKGYSAPNRYNIEDLSQAHDKTALAH